MFSSKSFRDYGLPFRSLNHFEFIFVYGVTKKQLLCSCTILGFALLGTMGLLCLKAAFLPSSPCEGAISTPMVLFPSRLPRVSLFLYLPGQQGKVVGSGLDRRKTNKYSINKIKKDKNCAPNSCIRSMVRVPLTTEQSLNTSWVFTVQHNSDTLIWREYQVP